jgi:hypothetical protein
MVRDIAVELRRQKLQGAVSSRGLSMAGLNVEALKVRMTQCKHLPGFPD